MANLNNKTRFFYVLYSDKTWVFDQSEQTQGPIYVINSYKLYDNGRVMVRLSHFIVIFQRRSTSCHRTY